MDSIDCGLTTCVLLLVAIPSAQAADVLATNGVIHVIDSVLLPPADDTPTQSIVELAVATPSLSTLVAALTAADLVDTLSGEGPFTVFAPTNDAFAALPEGTLDSLLLPENKDQLISILTYHVISGTVLSSDLTDGLEATTLQGGTVTARLDPVRINDAAVAARSQCRMTRSIGFD